MFQRVGFGGAPFPIICCNDRTTLPTTVDRREDTRRDANDQSLAYVYSRENPNDAQMAKVLTEDEARRIASNIAKLPTLLGRGS